MNRETPQIIGYMCGPRMYEYKGTKFEWHSYCGPHPIDDDLEPLDDIPDEFWDMIGEFQKLSDEEKEKYLIHRNGCVPIPGGNV
jgi:hypothetical protein